MEPFKMNDTIAAISTPPGMGGVALIRISGPEAVSIVNSAWKGADLGKVSSHSVHLGKYFSTSNELLDEALATVFLSPKSFTGENTVELSVHGSPWIQREILNDLIKRGIRIANPGEFTQRAFINGKLDLAQAEGVADLISSSSKAAHDMAVTQVKGSFSKEFHKLRDNLVEFASLIELELDFSEEDVEFADRKKLAELCENILDHIRFLADSYNHGAVLKNGVPVVIAGFPNAGKSSLLNLLLNDEKAIVTDIPGTTRDIIEDSVELDGILYRLMDTAGIRETSDIVEEIGVKKAYQALEKAFVIIWMIDIQATLSPQLDELNRFISTHPDKKIIVAVNKTDIPNSEQLPQLPVSNIPFSTFTKEGLNELLIQLKHYATEGQNLESDIIVTNARHYQSLIQAIESLSRALTSLKENLSGDIVAQDIRETIHHLSTITGSITSDTLLHSIFSRFCIGK